MCVHGYVYVGDETVWFEFCGLPVSQFSIFCSIFMPFCFIKLLNVYGPYIFVSAVWSMCFIIGEILTREDCVCVCVLCSIELLSKPAQAFIGFGGECHCGNNKTPLR